LHPNYPNPFNPATTISFSLPDAQNVIMSVYGVDGRRIATLVRGRLGAGMQEVVWTGRDDSGKAVSTGTYFYRINAGPYNKVNKMTLIK
jgi:flagellar hook assembly protein FlgD